MTNEDMRADPRTERVLEKGADCPPATRRQRSGRLGNLSTPVAALGRRVQTSETDRFAANVLPVIQAIQASGITSFGGIAKGAGRPRHSEGTRRALARFHDQERAPAAAGLSIRFMGGRT